MAKSRVNMERAQKRRRLLQHKPAISEDPLDWLNVKPTTKVQLPVFDDFRSDGTQVKVWWGKDDEARSILGRPNYQTDEGKKLVKYGKHLSPLDLSEIGYGGFWGDTFMTGSYAHSHASAQQPIRDGTQKKLAEHYKKGNCNSCGQVIRVRTKSKDGVGYETLVWDFFGEKDQDQTCRKCNIAMTYNYRLERMRKSSYSRDRARAQSVTGTYSSKPSTPSAPQQHLGLQQPPTKEEAPTIDSDTEMRLLEALAKKHNIKLSAGKKKVLKRKSKKPKNNNGNK